MSVEIDELKEKTVAVYNKIAAHYNRTHFDPSFWRGEFETFRKLVKRKKDY